MKNYAAALLQKHLSPSLRFRLRNTTAWLQEQLGRACVWRWEIVRFSLRRDSQLDLLYAGRPARREAAKALFGITTGADAIQSKTKNACQSVLVTEIPFPGSLCVPLSLRVIVPLGRPTDEIMESFESDLRRLIRKNRMRAHLQQVLDDFEINRAEMEMLRPYASARHGNSAHQIEPDEVHRIALKFGRLDFVHLEDEVVACHLGSEFSSAGKRYWSTIRFGFPETVFTNSKRLGETNAISFYLALEWANKNGLDYFDLGTCPGRPENSLLQWKKRWGGELSMMGYHDHLHVRLPSAGVAQFLWETPLFSAESNNLTLHLGLPDEPSEAEVLCRYRRMCFGGILKVYLHCTRPPSEHLLAKVKGLFKQLNSPDVEFLIST